MASLAADRSVPVVLMHMQGTPATMQAHPSYRDVVGEVLAFLADRVAKAEAWRCRRADLHRSGYRVWQDVGAQPRPARQPGSPGGHGPSRPGRSQPQAVHRSDHGQARPLATGLRNGRRGGPLCRGGVSVVRVHDVAAMVDVVKVASACSALPRTGVRGNLDGSLSH